MNTDIRLNITMASHVKIQKLQRSLGAEGVLSLIYLWMYAGVNHAIDGVLDAMDAEDIAIAGNYPGDYDKFVGELVRIKLLDESHGVYSIHNWGKRQPWASDAENRSDRARHAATVRHAKGKKTDTGSMPPVCAEHANGMRDASAEPAPLLSSPILTSPNQKDKKKKLPKKRFGEKVKLTEKEYQNLCDRYTKPALDEMIERMNNWAVAKGEKYDNYNQALHNWFKKRDDENKEKGGKISFYHCPKQCDGTYTVNDLGKPCSECSTPIMEFQHERN